MEIVTIPQAFDEFQDAPIRVIDYRSSNPCQKQKVNLDQNTISFLMEGAKEVFADTSTLSIRNSHFLVMRSGHCLMTEKLSFENSYRSVLLFFSDELLLSLATKHLAPMTDEEAPASIVAIPYDTFLHAFVQSLLGLQTLPPEAQTPLLLVKLEELFLYLLQTNPSTLQLFLKGTKDNRTQRLIQVVESNRLKKLSLHELAFLCNMSISSFKRAFQKQFGTSPSKWFHKKRLEHAAYLLEKEGKRASDIFEDAGYENLSNFIQAFKTRYGMTPKKFQSQ